MGYKNSRPSGERVRQGCLVTSARGGRGLAGRTVRSGWSSVDGELGVFVPRATLGGASVETRDAGGHGRSDVVTVVVAFLLAERGGHAADLHQARGRARRAGCGGVLEEHSSEHVDRAKRLAVCLLGARDHGLGHGVDLEGVGDLLTRELCHPVFEEALGDLDPVHLDRRLDLVENVPSGPLVEVPPCDRGRDRVPGEADRPGGSLPCELLGLPGGQEDPPVEAVLLHLHLDVHREFFGAHDQDVPAVLPERLEDGFGVPPVDHLHALVCRDDLLEGLLDLLCVGFRGEDDDGLAVGHDAGPVRLRDLLRRDPHEHDSLAHCVPLN